MADSDLPGLGRTGFRNPAIKYQERRKALLKGLWRFYSAATVATSAPITDCRSAQTWRIRAASA